jgi:hypothetical protein
MAMGRCVAWKGPIMKNTCEQFRRLSRREFLRVGGTSLCGLSLLDVLRARAAPAARPAKAKQMICVWMAGGPPHIDMFDMKPDAPADYRGEFKPIRTNVPGLDSTTTSATPSRRASWGRPTTRSSSTPPRRRTTLPRC